ncbi:hypothetical protein AGMMS49579_01080 [Spirochaetia bacterium]|nr:hypothetical protein AGMMS49579_01080 [Spirochaetia bacterium]
MASKYICTMNCTKDEFRETFDNIEFSFAKSLFIIYSEMEGKFNFYLQFSDDANDLEIQKFAYSDDINKILYEPTNKIMSLYEIMKQPHVIGVHISELQILPRFRVIFGKEENFHISYYVPKLNVFLSEKHVTSSKLVKDWFPLIARSHVRRLIQWDYNFINQTTVETTVDYDKVVPEDKIGSEVCKVCMENAVNTLFRPCMHAASCKRCSDQLDKCHICKAEIKEKLRIFLS